MTLRVLASPAFRNRHRNPYNALLYGALAGLGVEVREFSPARLLGRRADVWHLHWPDSHLRERHRSLAALRLSALLRMMDVARLRGTRLVWTVHNLRSHEAKHPGLEARFWPAFTRRLDAFVSLSAAGVEGARREFPGLRRTPAFVVPHGHYRGVYPDDVGRGAARERLGVAPDAPVVAFLGQLRPYKNVPALVEAFRGLQAPDAVLLVAGKAWGDEGDRIRRAARDDPRVRLHFGFVPDPHLQLYLRAADLVALPYREVLNSGSAILALSFDRPVLVPARGAMAELAATAGDAWVRTFDGELSTGLLEDALRWARDAARPTRAPIGELAWETVARRLFEALQEIVR